MVQRACQLWSRGRRGQAATETPLEGPLLPAMDEESRGRARKLYDALGIEGAEQRFRALADLTAAHFDREQAVFTAGMGATRSGAAPRWPPLKERLTRLTTVNAPTVREERLKFEAWSLPKGFDVRDHQARAEQFGRAFVRSITGSIDVYRVAAAEVIRRYDGSEPPRYINGSARLLDWDAVVSAA